MALFSQIIIMHALHSGILAIIILIYMCKIDLIIYFYKEVHFELPNYMYIENSYVDPIEVEIRSFKI